MSRYSIALGGKKSKIRKVSLDRLTMGNPGQEEKISIRFIIADALFPFSEEIATEVASYLMDIPDNIALDIVHRLQKKDLENGR